MFDRKTIQKIALAGILAAVGVVGGTLSIPVGFTRCCPTQSVINVIAGVFLGPWYSVGMAFCVSLIRNMLGTGTIMAFPGSMCGALLCGIVYSKCAKVIPTAIGEIFGTGIIGGLLAYPIAIAFMGVSAAKVAFYAYIIPFLISTTVGSVLAVVIVLAVQRAGALNKIQSKL